MSEPERSVARDNLLRTKPFTLARATDGGDQADDGLTLEGHAAVFDERTVIDSWFEGRFTEEIAPGAFKKTFRERTPVLQFDHGSHPLVGSIPIGRLQEAREDDVGAYVKGRLHDNWLVQPVRDAIREESVTGMSFRFSVVREEWRDKKGQLIEDDDELLNMLFDKTDYPVRTLKELRVPELGPVVFPAYEATDVGVRSGRTVIDLGELRQDPAARKSLARALWLAEANTPDAPDADDAPPTGHPPTATDQRDDAPPPPGHPSTSPPTRPGNAAAADAAAMRARLTSIKERTT